MIKRTGQIQEESLNNPLTTGLGSEVMISGFHPRVVEIAGKLFEDGYFRQAILDTYIALVEQVKAKSGRHDLDGTRLMENVFSADNPKIIVSDDRDEQLGLMWLFKGAVMGFRNAKAHKH